jgi:hypothetical protein
LQLSTKIAAAQGWLQHTGEESLYQLSKHELRGSFTLIDAAVL